MLGPASCENEGAGSGTGRVRALSLVTCARWCWCGGIVSAVRARGLPGGSTLKPVRTPVAILGSPGVCIYVPASRHWLISYSLIHLT